MVPATYEPQDIQQYAKMCPMNRAAHPSEARAS